MATPLPRKRPPISPHRFDPWSLSPKENWKQFTCWLASLKGEDPFNLFGIFWVLLCPLVALYGLFKTTWHPYTIVFTLIYYFWAAVSLTGGYHRLFSHRTYSVNPIWRFLILLISSSTMQGTVLVWARNHRAHHRYMDTDKDPYDATKGFWWSHEGWAIQQHRPEEMSEIDISDLTSDPVVMFSHKYYGLMAISSGLVFPWLFCGLLWGDFLGGLWLGGIIRIVVFLHCTFLINSLAHYSGEKTYSEHITPVDNMWANILTLGEGYHNFHHSFPYDYRGSEVKLRIDPVKWLVDIASFLGIAYDVKSFPDKFIQHTRMEKSKRDLEKIAARIAPGPPIATLPLMTSQDVKRRVLEGAGLIIIEGVAYDVTRFLPEHPGGDAILKLYYGKDATNAFNGLLVRHTASARILLASLAVARIQQEENEKKD
jgi:stearoyl-CoA desaturase (delta-9 desaturase)